MRETLIYNEAKTISLRSSSEKTTAKYKRIKLEYSLTSLKKKKIQIKDLNVRLDTVKLLEENRDKLTQIAVRSVSTHLLR